MLDIQGKYNTAKVFTDNIDIPTLADVKKQENELIAKKEAKQLVVQSSLLAKFRKHLIISLMLA